MGYATILGLDLGKFKSVCCAMEAATGRHAFETIPTTPATVRELLARHAAGGGGGGVLLVVETRDPANEAAGPVSVRVNDGARPPSRDRPSDPRLKRTGP
jgi:hypothetical protein